MNIHEHQAKELLKKFGVPVPNGVVAFSVEEVIEKSKLLKTNKYVLKAQIHAGGRGKAGGIKIVNNLNPVDLKFQDVYINHYHQNLFLHLNTKHFPF